VLLSSCFIYNSSGSIDENAIQNLSVIVNITKNIQIKSQPGDSSDRDPEEYSKYFPSFNWVLRDFALQLIDSQGEQLTPKVIFYYYCLFIFKGIFRKKFSNSERIF